MTTTNYAIINSNDVVINLIVWDGKTRYLLATGTRIMKANGASIGDLWDGEKFIPNPQKGN